MSGVDIHLGRRGSRLGEVSKSLSVVVDNGDEKATGEHFVTWSPSSTEVDLMTAGIRCGLERMSSSSDGLLTCFVRFES